ncbi:MAG TPA: hypothetical protein VNQ79_21705 [Blastocatellia bacterium]|nr:hypothetical protein [Blastocatellia bacterium]
MTEKLVLPETTSSADEGWLPESDLPFDYSRKTPVGLRSVTHALSRNWQALGEAQCDPSDDDHYLSAAREPVSSAELTFDAGLFSELLLLTVEKIQFRLHTFGEAQQQLATELALLARSK